jgi:hypothetical protein
LVGERVPQGQELGRALLNHGAVARTSGASCSRVTFAVPASFSAAASSATRKFDAIAAAAW